MNIYFYKYQGTGNDFIIIDNRSKFFPAEDVSLIKKLCDRRFGIGADGLMLLQNLDNCDFEMVYFNSDGNESSMCGNGGRCLVAFAKHLGVIGNTAKFLAIDGVHEAEILVNGLVALKMQDVASVEKLENAFVLNTGSPHYVDFCNDVKALLLVEKAKKIRYNERFSKAGINVNFVETLSENSIKIRTYERGVEDETLSCGTGGVACAIASYENKKSSKTSGNFLYNIEVEGGKLQVKFMVNENGSFTDVWLIGPVEKVFEGEVGI